MDRSGTFLYKKFFSKIYKKIFLNAWIYLGHFDKNKFFATIKHFFRNYKKIFYTTIKKISHNYKKNSSQLYKKNFFPTIKKFLATIKKNMKIKNKKEVHKLKYSKGFFTRNYLSESLSKSS